MLAMLLCMLVSVFILGVPYRGSLPILFVITSLFLLSTLGMGLLISTITRNQFNARAGGAERRLFTVDYAVRVYFPDRQYAGGDPRGDLCDPGALFR